MNTRTVFSTLFIFALPLLMLGCDGGGSAMEETQEPAELTFTITNPAGSNAQTNDVTLDRPASSVESGDQINIFVRKSDGSQMYSETLSYPAPGDSENVEFGVATGDYSVDLIAFQDVGTNSAVYAATTSGGSFGIPSADITLASGEVKTVDFAGGSNNELLEPFDLSFSVPLELASESQGGSEVRVDLSTISDDDLTSLFEGGGGIGINPEPFSDLSNSLESYSAFSKVGSELVSDQNLKLSPGKYKSDGTASVLLQLKLISGLSIGNQGPIYLYNNADATSEDDVGLEGSGIIIILP